MSHTNMIQKRSWQLLKGQPLHFKHTTGPQIEPLVGELVFEGNSQQPFLIRQNLAIHQFEKPTKISPLPRQKLSNSISIVTVIFLSLIAHSLLTDSKCLTKEGSPWPLTVKLAELQAVKLLPKLD